MLYTPEPQESGETRLGPFLFTFRPTSESEAVTIPGLLVPLQWPATNSSPQPPFDPHAAPYSAFVYTEFSAAPVQPVWSVSSGLVASWIPPPLPTPRPSPTPEEGHRGAEEGERKEGRSKEDGSGQRSPLETASASTMKAQKGKLAEKGTTSQSCPKRTPASTARPVKGSDLFDISEESTKLTTPPSVPPRPPRRVNLPQRPVLPSQWRPEVPNVSFKVTDADSEPVSPVFERPPSALSTL